MNLEIQFTARYQLKCSPQWQFYNMVSNFTVPVKDNKIISVNVDYGTKEITADSNFVISERLHKSLLSDENFLPSRSEESTIEELNSILSNFDFAVRKVVSLIRYCTGGFAIDDDLVFRRDLRWFDGVEFKNIKNTGTHHGSRVVTSQAPENLEKEIQRYLDSKFTPLFGLKYIFRALQEEVPNFKIIDATTAAELAIKEFLILKNPDLRPLLLKLPSPPLDVLYGSILTYYTGGEENGYKCPKTKTRFLKIGSEIRNSLIHTPLELENPEYEIPYHLAYYYCENVHFVIYSLMCLLYPDDWIVQCLRPAVAREPVVNKDYDDEIYKALQKFYENLKKSQNSIQRDNLTRL
jgi:hypothetical protein